MQKLNTLFTLLAVAIFTTTSFGQSADKLLEKLSEKAKGYNTIYAEFESTLVDKQADLEMTQEGKVKVKGEKYRLNLQDYIIISDGENVWTYEKETNTAYIDYKEDTEQGSVSPSDIFTIWETGFKSASKGTVQENGKTLEVVDLYPKEPADKPYHTIKLHIDKTTMEIVKVIVKGREGSDTVYSVNEFDPNRQFKDSEFTFNKSEFPGVEVIDNRI